MARPKIDSRLQNIEKDIAEVKEMVKNGNEQNIPEEQKQPVDCLCEKTKTELEPDAE